LSDAEALAPTEDAWTAAIRAGDYARAWLLADAALHRDIVHGPAKHDGPRHLQRIWRGEPFDGRRVLVRCYHGLGDTLQFARFLAPLRRRAAHVTLWCQPELMPLLRGLEEVDDCLPLHDGTPDVDFDVDLEIMELAHALRAGADAIACPPYLRIPRAPDPLDAGFSGLRVGLVWEAGGWDARRSLPAAALAPLAELADIDLVSLQRGPAAAQAGVIPARDASTSSIAELAVRLGGLDLLITVDTMVAHLAGAVGVTAWLLLHSACDWRWPLQRTRTLWYPTLRLFHQRAPGDWDGVIARVAGELRRPKSAGGVA
jgi:hypothetical protein